MAPLTAGTLLGGRYRLVTPLARGGMAEVWEAHDEVLARAVAVKVLHPELAADEGLRERFRREAISAARLVHPNIVATYDTGADDETVWIVMELVRGRDLRAELDRAGGRLPVGPALAIAAQVCDALSAAHAAGIVHRDVKPANVLLCEDAPSLPGSVKVADFGIARTVLDGGEPDLTAVGEVLGTAKYLSPEQARGDTPDARSDVYSLAVVVYEAVCGRPPFVADTAMATAMAHIGEEPLRPRQLRPDVPRSLEAVLMRALSKDPAARPQSAAELRADLLAVDVEPEIALEPGDHGTAADATFGQSERSWLVPTALIATAAVVLVALSLAFSRSEVGRELLNRDAPPTTTATAALIPVTEVRVLDPGDGREKNDLLRFVTDPDPATAWRTDTYSSRRFGNLKPGLGLVLRLERSAPLASLTVRSPTRGWDASVFVAPQPADAVAAWGPAVTGRTGIAGDVTFDLGGREGGAVLLWITSLGEGNRVEISGIAVGPR